MSWGRRRRVAWQSRVVASGDVDIAGRDWRGGGPDLVLLHGLGADQRSLEPLATALTPSFHVVTYDQRGAGTSTGGPWTFAAALDDLGAVIASYGLANPVVVGHSLGGMIAVMYGGTHPDAPAVVNVDGWGPGRPEQYLGEDPATVGVLHDRLARLEPHTPIGRLIDPLVKRMPAVRRRDGMVREAVGALGDLDVLALHRGVGCPVLAFNCTAPTTGVTRVLLGATGDRLLQSYRRGLRRDLAALVATRPNVTVVELDAPHFLIRTAPDLVADRIRSFVSEHQQVRTGAVAEPMVGSSGEPTREPKPG